MEHEERRQTGGVGAGGQCAGCRVPRGEKVVAELIRKGWFGYSLRWFQKICVWFR